MPVYAIENSIKAIQLTFDLIVDFNSFAERGNKRLMKLWNVGEQIE